MDPETAALAQGIADALNKSAAVNHLAQQIPLALLVAGFCLLMLSGAAWVALRVQKVFQGYLESRDLERQKFEAKLEGDQERREEALRQTLERLTDAIANLAGEVRSGQPPLRRFPRA